MLMRTKTFKVPHVELLFGLKDEKWTPEGSVTFMFLQIGEELKGLRTPLSLSSKRIKRFVRLV